MVLNPKARLCFSGPISPLRWKQDAMGWAAPLIYANGWSHIPLPVPRLALPPSMRTPLRMSVDRAHGHRSWGSGCSGHARPPAPPSGADASLYFCALCNEM